MKMMDKTSQQRHRRWDRRSRSGDSSQALEVFFVIVDVIFGKLFRRGGKERIQCLQDRGKGRCKGRWSSRTSYREDPPLPKLPGRNEQWWESYWYWCLVVEDAGEAKHEERGDDEKTVANAQPKKEDCYRAAHHRPADDSFIGILAALAALWPKDCWSL